MQVKLFPKNFKSVREQVELFRSETQKLVGINTYIWAEVVKLCSGIKDIVNPDTAVTIGLSETTVMFVMFPGIGL